MADSPLTEDQHYAAVICHGDSVPGQQSCGQVPLSESEYDRQMNRPDRLWMCPRCGSTAAFDDDYFEEHHPDNPNSIEEGEALRAYIAQLESTVNGRLVDETSPNDARDAVRYRWLRDWYHRDGKRAEIDPYGHIAVRTLPEWEVLLDAAIARGSVEETTGNLLRPASKQAPPGCYCTERCAAPVIMGRQTSCRDPEKAARFAEKASAPQERHNGRPTIWVCNPCGGEHVEKPARCSRCGSSNLRPAQGAPNGKAKL